MISFEVINCGIDKWESMVVTVEMSDAQLAELVKQLNAGNEVLLTQQGKTIARLLAINEGCVPPCPPRNPLMIRSFTGHQILKPVKSQTDLAEEFF